MTTMPGQPFCVTRSSGAGVKVCCVFRHAWQLSAGVGSKGQRFYDWAWISIRPSRTGASVYWWLLIRRWTSWQRWTILAMLACAFLAVVTATERAENPTPQGVSLIALTCNEIRHLFNLAAHSSPGHASVLGFFMSGTHSFASRAT